MLVRQITEMLDSDIVLSMDVSKSPMFTGAKFLFMGAATIAVGGVLGPVVFGGTLAELFVAQALSHAHTSTALHALGPTARFAARVVAHAPQ